MPSRGDKIFTGIWILIGAIAVPYMWTTVSPRAGMLIITFHLIILLIAYGGEAVAPKMERNAYQKWSSPMWETFRSAVGEE